MKGAVFSPAFGPMPLFQPFRIEVAYPHHPKFFLDKKPVSIYQEAKRSRSALTKAALFTHPTFKLGGKHEKNKRIISSLCAIVPAALIYTFLCDYCQRP